MAAEESHGGRRLAPGYRPQRLNTARAYTGEEPAEVFARLWSRPDDPRFREVEDNVSLMLAFHPARSRTASAATTRTTASRSGFMRRKPGSPLRMPSPIEAGQVMRIGHRAGVNTAIDQLELASKEAIYESARMGAPVQLPRFEKLDVTRGPAPTGG